MIEEKQLLPSNCLTLNVLFVVAHQASLIDWQNFRLSAMLIVITHHIKFLKVLNVQSRWFTDNRVMLSPCVESASEEKSAEISMGQQDRGTLVFYFSPPPKQFSNRNSHLLLSPGAISCQLRRFTSLQKWLDFSDRDWFIILELF